MENTVVLRLSAQLREKIEEGIVAGQFPPGTRLDEVELAQLYGVSRTPVREALIQLSAAGLVGKRPRKGWEVATHSGSRLTEMFEVMAELEVMCVRLAVRRATPDEIRGLRLLHEACKAAHDDADPDAYYRQNEAFHRALYRLSHNAFLIEQADSVAHILRPYRRLQLRVRNRIRASFSEHDAVVLAIENGNTELAERLIRAHVMVQGDRFADLIASLNRVGLNAA